MVAAVHYYLNHYFKKNACFQLLFFPSTTIILGDIDCSAL